MWNRIFDLMIRLITYRTKLRFINPESTRSCVPTVKQLEVPLQKGWEEGVETQGKRDFITAAGFVQAVKQSACGSGVRVTVSSDALFLTSLL